MNAGSGERPVFIHAGLTKTGTSYLQSILWSCQSTLAERGVSLVPPSRQSCFELMLDLRGRLEADADRPEAAEAVARLPEQVAAMSGRIGLITEESLAAAPPEEIARLMAALTGREVHLLLTVRDLARQIPSAWQQSVQATRQFTYDEYLTAALTKRGRASVPFWAQHGLIGILENWEQFLPRDRVHVVTVPQRGAPPSTLLERFCSVLDLDSTGLSTDEPRTNPSLGRLQAELLVRINTRLPAHLRRRDINGDVVKRFFAKQVLEPQAGARALVPREHEPWCRVEAERVINHLVDGGYDVIGDPDDLLPAAESFTDEDQVVDEADMAEVATQALVTMLTQRAENRVTAKDRKRRRFARAAADVHARGD